MPRLRGVCAVAPLWVLSTLTVAALLLGTVPSAGVTGAAPPAPAVGTRLQAGVATAVDSSAPDSAGQSDGVEDLFWKSTANTLMHSWYVPSSGWHGPQTMEGSMSSGPDPILTGGAHLDVFFKGSNGSLWHVFYLGTWSSPQNLGMGTLGGAPRAVSPQSGAEDVFWRGSNGGLWYAWFSGSWHGPQSLAPAGTVASDPDPVSDASGAIQVFYKGTDGAAHMVAYQSSSWTSPTALPSGTIGSMPHAAVVGSGQIDVAWQGTDGGLWYDALNGGRWTGPSNGSAGALGSQPDVVSTASGRADVYWRGGNGWLWEEQIANGRPQGLRELPTQAMGSEPDPDVTSPSAEDVFWRGQNGGIWHEWGNGAASWEGPQQVAVPPPTSITLGVPFYHQQESLTCEEAALRMALAYFGKSVTEQQVLNDEGIDRVHYFTGAGGGDPFADFVGNPNGSEITNTGYGSYWSAISRATADLGGSVAWAGTGLSPGSVYNDVLNGEPVIFWVPFDWDTPGRNDYTAFDGRRIPYAGPEEHAMVVVGVTSTEVRVNDPDRGQYWVPRSQFQANFAVYGDMAVVIN